MAEGAVPPNSEVKVLPPDFSLLKKLGGAKLDQLFSAQAVQDAQKVIAASSETLLGDSLTGLMKLEEAAKTLETEPNKVGTLLTDIVTAAFNVKSNAGMSGYELAAELAKSLQLGCEKLDSSKATAVDAQVIIWHISCLKKVLNLKLKGTGGGDRRSNPRGTRQS